MSCAFFLLSIFPFLPMFVCSTKSYWMNHWCDANMHMEDVVKKWNKRKSASQSVQCSFTNERSKKTEEKNRNMRRQWNDMHKNNASLVISNEFLAEKKNGLIHFKSTIMHTLVDLHVINGTALSIVCVFFFSLLLSSFFRFSFTFMKINMFAVSTCTTLSAIIIRWVFILSSSRSLPIPILIFSQMKNKSSTCFFVAFNGNRAENYVHTFANGKLHSFEW